MAKMFLWRFSMYTLRRTRGLVATSSSSTALPPTSNMCQSLRRARRWSPLVSVCCALSSSRNFSKATRGKGQPFMATGHLVPEVVVTVK
eukprot:15485874-Alexandrium_andersonii.AAC.2